MEKKHKKVSEIKQPQPQIRVQPRPIQKPGILPDKDRQILDDVQNIIWDPDRLNKFKNDGNPAKPELIKKKPAK
jgi:hypothetical protein